MYISCGEDFDDPFLKTKAILDKRKAVLWTSNGVHFMSQDDISENNQDLKANMEMSNNASKLNKSKLKSLLHSKRLVVYENGTEFNPASVIMEALSSTANTHLKTSDIEKFELEFLKDFLDECSNRLKCSANGK